MHAFERAGQFGDDYSHLACQSLELQPIVRAFIRNMNRVRGLGVSPISLVATTVINEAATVEALTTLKIPLHDSSDYAQTPEV